MLERHIMLQDKLANMELLLVTNEAAEVDMHLSELAQLLCGFTEIRI